MPQNRRPLLVQDFLEDGTEKGRLNDQTIFTKTYKLRRRQSSNNERYPIKKTNELETNQKVVPQRVQVPRDER